MFVSVLVLGLGLGLGARFPRVEGAAGLAAEERLDRRVCEPRLPFLAVKVRSPRAEPSPQLHVGHRAHDAAEQGERLAVRLPRAWVRVRVSVRVRVKG